MIYTQKIQHAIRFAIKTHEIYQKQKRKGKDVPYITHPLVVGIILARAGANEDVIIAGILHDTIEDSVQEKKPLMPERIEERFGKNVLDLVMSVTEQNKELSWEERKVEAIEHIKTFSNDSVLIKSADVISNASETITDYEKNGEDIFSKFNASKDKILENYLRVINALLSQWSENPLSEDLQNIVRKFQSIGKGKFMSDNPAKMLEYTDYNENMPIQCSVCGWKGTPKDSGWIEYYDELFDVSCPNCEKMLLIVDSIVK
jgi:hypothetical protein